MRKEQLLLTWCCAALLVLLAGCAEVKKPGPDTNPIGSGSSVHPAGWMDTTTTNFHGAYLKARRWDPSNCASCHGGAFKGGTSGVACFTCHPSVPHQAQFTAGTGGHPGYLQAKLYPLGECKTCHGGSYTGGTRVDVSCSKSGCHVDRNQGAKSPEACNTCHGRFNAPANDTLSFAPPGNINGDTLTTSRGVGAHQLHLTGAGTLTQVSVACAECHNVPASVFAAGHMDSAPPAEVAITSALARHPSSGVTPAPVFNSTTQSCAGTYCHGNFTASKATSPSVYQFAYAGATITGSNASPVWTAGSAAAACGTCHGLPPTGHVDFSSSATCANCHYGILDPSIPVDKAKHMNGKINIFGVERDF